MGCGSVESHGDLLAAEKIVAFLCCYLYGTYPLILKLAWSSTFGVLETEHVNTYLIQCTSCTSARNMAVHFLEWYFHILITEGEPVCAEAKISVWPSNARAETCKVLFTYS